MYLERTKALFVDAIKTTFDSDFPEPDFQDLFCSLEMPVEKANYPGIWVDFNPAGRLKRAGVDHIEYDTDGMMGRAYTRWRFQGSATFTCVAMTSRERDRLHDELIRVFAFGDEFTATQRFRSVIEDNEFIDLNMSFDEIQTQGSVNTMGTPWGTNDQIYEVTLVMECLGEFVADALTFDLAPLEAINVFPYNQEDIDGSGEAQGWQIDTGTGSDESPGDESPGDSPGALEPLTIPLDGSDDGHGPWV